MRLVKLWLPVAIWAAFILSASNDRFSIDETGGWLTAVFGPLPYFVHVLFRKAGHVVAYGLLGALTWRADRRWSVVLAVVLFVASTDEWLQSRTLRRSGTPWDVVLDATAAALVVAGLHRARAKQGAG